MSRASWIGAVVLIGVFVTAGVTLALWKESSLRAAADEANHQPEPAEVVTTVAALPREHRSTITSIATVVALRSITLRNELPGTVRRVSLPAGKVVESGTLLVALDTSVEEAELAALQAEARLAASLVQRQASLGAEGATPREAMDRAEANHAVALARIARTQAIIAQKTLRAPFRARVGISDLHPGQYLEQGTPITTLQGAEQAVYLDFAVPQQVAAGLRQGDRVELPGSGSLSAEVMAVDARVDPATRNATVRARLDATEGALAPGASVRVQVAAGAAVGALSLPASALRRDPEGDHVFVIDKDETGQPRARLRRVRTSAQLGDEVLIQEGIAAGEQVAAKGSFKLRDGALVSVTPAASALQTAP